jgi:predicted secreted Zn-dependent protease
MRPLLLAVLLLLPAAAAAQSDPDGRVERHVEVRYYAVEGGTAAELARSLQTHGPSAEGAQFYGLTEWTLNARYTWVGQAKSCQAEDVVVRVNTTITLPRWDAPRGTPPELVAAWHRFVRALEAHEREHQRLAEEGAETLRWRLATLRLSSCQGAQAQAQHTVSRVVDETNRRNRQYDERTQHGVAEGAAWPPPRRVGAPPPGR